MGRAGKSPAPGKLQPSSARDHGTAAPSSLLLNRQGQGLPVARFPARVNTTKAAGGSAHAKRSKLSDPPQTRTAVGLPPEQSQPLPHPYPSSQTAVPAGTAAAAAVAAVAAAVAAAVETAAVEAAEAATPDVATITAHQAVSCDLLAHSSPESASCTSRITHGPRPPPRTGGTAACCCKLPSPGADAHPRPRPAREPAFA